MRAFVKTSAADTRIELLDVPIPQIGEHELLVRIHAVGVGVHDEYFHPPIVPYPYVVGIEAAGVIESVGAEVSDLQPGERIAFVSAMQSKGGVWAEYAAVADGAQIVRIPEAMSFAEAAALPVPGNTILKVFHALGLKPDDTLLIAGGAGAIGTLAIQLAARRGYKVFASASKKNHEYMASLGAYETVDYSDQGWQEQVKHWYPNGVNAAIAIHPGTAEPCEAAVRNNGTIVAVSGDHFVPKRGIRLEQVPHDVDVNEELAELYEQVVSGEIKLTIEHIYPFEDGLEALEKVKTRHTRGKLVLSLDSP